MGPAFFPRSFASLVPAFCSRKRTLLCCWRFAGKWMTSSWTDWRATGIFQGHDSPGLEATVHSMALREFCATARVLPEDKTRERESNEGLVCSYPGRRTRQSDACCRTRLAE